MAKESVTNYLRTTPSPLKLVFTLKKKKKKAFTSTYIECQLCVKPCIKYLGDVTEDKHFSSVVTALFF